MITKTHTPNRSASHPDIPDTGRCVRVSDYFSKMVIKSHSRVDELGLDFDLTYFDDAKTSLPSSCVNWVAYTGEDVALMCTIQYNLPNQNFRMKV